MSGDWIGVGEVISTEEQNACFCGTGEMSMASGIGQGDDDAGRGGVVMDSVRQCQCQRENQDLYSLPRSII